MMRLKATLLFEMTNALKSQKINPHAKVRLSTLRAVMGEIIKAEVQAPHNLTDKEIENILRHEAKARRETAQHYHMFNVSDRAYEEEAEAEFLEMLLPRLLTEDETYKIVESYITEQGIAVTNGDASWKLMKMLKTRSDIDMSIASKIIHKALSQE